MNLLVQAVMGQIFDLARTKGFTEARVLQKVNARGELVIALVIPPRTPGEWGMPSPSSARDAKRREREKRS